MVRGTTFPVQRLQYPSGLFLSAPPRAFMVQAVLGRAIFGTVVLAETADEQCRQVTLKIVAQDSRHEEARLHSSLHHPNIFAIYGFFEHDQSLIIAIQFCACGDLFRHVRSTELPEHEIAALVQDVLRGLLYLHGHGIVHGDFVEFTSHDCLLRS